MNARIRGLIIFAVIVVVAVFACGILPFVMMPGSNIAMALPIIAVPGEIVVPGGLFGVDLTNTLIGIFVADAVVIILALLAWRSSKGWTKEVPGRFQAFMEVLVEGIYGFLKNLGGDRLRTAPLLWPLVATIFFLLLAANLVKLVPGVESVGITHCAHVGYSGYPISPITEGGSSFKLHVDTALNAGYPQTEETEHTCVTWFHAYEAGHISRLNIADGESFESVKSHLEEELSTLKTQLGTATGDELALVEEEIHFVELQIASADQAMALEPVIEAQRAALAAATAAPAEDAHGEATDSHGEEAASEETTTEEAATTEETTTEGETAEGEAHSEEVVVAQTAPVDVAVLEAELAANETAYNLAVAGVQFPGATLPLTEAQMDAGAFPYIFHITPFVRGAASDLSLTIAYAIMAVIAVQAYGVYALGPAYFEKFINLSALGNLSKRPLGAIDFVVGLFEIISEFAKIISLAFRLFGNIFAGGVALIAISFLVATLVPGVILLLELVIGAVQALVFSVLTLVFVVQAMEHHGGGDDHGHGHDEAHDAAHH